MTLDILIFSEYMNQLQNKTFELSEEKLTNINNTINNYFKNTYEEIGPILNDKDLINLIVEQESFRSDTPYFVTSGEICKQLSDIIQIKDDFLFGMLVFKQREALYRPYEQQGTFSSL